MTFWRHDANCGKVVLSTSGLRKMTFLFSTFLGRQNQWNKLHRVTCTNVSHTLRGGSTVVWQGSKFHKSREIHSVTYFLDDPKGTEDMLISPLMIRAGPLLAFLGWWINRYYPLWVIKRAIREGYHQRWIALRSWKFYRRAWAKTRLNSLYRKSAMPMHWNLDLWINFILFIFQNLYIGLVYYTIDI